MKDVLKIADGVLKECTDKDVESVVIPEGVTEIGGCAFKGCESLASVEIPSSVTAIGKQAFRDCKSLSSVEIPSSVTVIGERAFWYCTSLTSVEIPSSVTEIGAKAFKGCNINELSHPALTIKNGIAIRDNEVLCCASHSTSVVTIPEDVTKISDYAFSHCESLSSVEIPSSVTAIGACAFECCASLESVEFGGTVAQWKSVEKMSGWHYGFPATTVKCSDGEARL